MQNNFIAHQTFPRVLTLFKNNSQGKQAAQQFVDSLLTGAPLTNTTDALNLMDSIPSFSKCKDIIYTWCHASMAIQGAENVDYMVEHIDVSNLKDDQGSRPDPVVCRTLLDMGLKSLNQKYLARFRTLSSSTTSSSSSSTSKSSRKRSLVTVTYDNDKKTSKTLESGIMVQMYHDGDLWPANDGEHASKFMSMEQYESLVPKKDRRLSNTPVDWVCDFTCDLSDSTCPENAFYYAVIKCPDFNGTKHYATKYTYIHF